MVGSFFPLVEVKLVVPAIQTSTELDGTLFTVVTTAKDRATGEGRLWAVFVKGDGWFATVCIGVKDNFGGGMQLGLVFDRARTMVVISGAKPGQNDGLVADFVKIEDQMVDGVFDVDERESKDVGEQINDMGHKIKKLGFGE